VRAVTYGNNLVRAKAEKSVSSRCAAWIRTLAAPREHSAVPWPARARKRKASDCGDLRFCPSTRVENKHAAAAAAGKKCLRVSEMLLGVYAQGVCRPSRRLMTGISRATAD
jgi:hypothetical protein